MIIISKHATVLTDKVDDDDEIREALAAIQHEIWSHWMKHLFAVCVDMGDHLLIPKSLWDKWHRQTITSYANLADAEKESDRQQADKVMALLYGQYEE